MFARCRCKPSSSEDDKVTFFQASFGNDAFSIAAGSCLTHLPQQPIDYIPAAAAVASKLIKLCGTGNDCDVK